MCSFVSNRGKMPNKIVDYVKYNNHFVFCISEPEIGNYELRFGIKKAKVVVKNLRALLDFVRMYDKNIKNKEVIE